MTTQPPFSIASDLANEPSWPRPITTRPARPFDSELIESCVSALAAPPSPGDIIAGKYALERHLSHGGMGAVWVARHIELNDVVALKLMSSKYVSLPLERARFMREARSAARLRSRHVVNVFDYGVDGATPYLVMELLEGEDLGSRLERLGALSLEEAETIFTPVAKALELARGAGIVHRDLKPSNIFIAHYAGEEDEVVKVLDFGIAKEMSAEIEHEITASGTVMGTPHYMSPEQAMGVKKIDHRSDIWSLGVILFLALTGRLPFPKSEPVEILDDILKAPIPLPSRIAPHLPPEVDRFFALALARERRHRFQSIAEMATAFKQLVSASASTSASAFTPPSAQAPQRIDDEIDPNGPLGFDISSGDFIAIDVSQVDWGSPPHSTPASTSTPSAVTLDKKTLSAPCRRIEEPGARLAPQGHSVRATWWLFGALIAVIAVISAAFIQRTTGF